jgi:hypothetical protein
MEERKMIDAFDKSKYPNETELPLKISISFIILSKKVTQSLHIYEYIGEG